MASHGLLNEGQILSATHSRCYNLNSNYSFIFLFHYLPLFKLACVQFHKRPVLSCTYATAHTAPSKCNGLLSVTIFQRLSYKGQLTSHKLLNEVCLLPRSRNNLSPLPTPYHFVGIILLKLIIFLPCVIIFFSILSPLSHR